MLSEAEKAFIHHGVQVTIFLLKIKIQFLFFICIMYVTQDDLRCDGRSRLDYRPIVLETGLVSNASGSARLRLANSDILVGIKVELDVPVLEKPNEGRLEFFVDWYD